jgi:hypothetical protein
VEGALSLTATRLLAPHLTADNQAEVLELARHKKTREVEVIVARLRPLPPVPSTVRKLPERLQRPLDAKPVDASLDLVTSQPPSPPSSPSPQPPASHRSVVQPLSPTSYRLQITLTSGAHDKLREAQALSRHAVPNGDPSAIVERALDALLLQLRRARFADAAKPREGLRPSNGRHIPSAVRRAVWARDGARCAFVGAGGRRCEGRDFLEYHHVVAFAKGGAATIANIQLRCRAHNAHEARLEFGESPGG